MEGSQLPWQHLCRGPEAFVASSGLADFSLVLCLFHSSTRLGTFLEQKTAFRFPAYLPTDDLLWARFGALRHSREWKGAKLPPDVPGSGP